MNSNTAPHGVRWREVLALAGLVAFTAAVTPATLPLEMPDSESYLQFYAVRTAVYPMFLEALAKLGLSRQHVPVVQIAILTTVTAWLIAELTTIFSSWRWPTIITAATCLAIPVNGLHKTILTESMFISSTVAYSACVIAFAQAQTLGRWLLLLFFSSLSLTIRPAGLPLTLSLPVLLFVWRWPVPRARLARVCALSVIAWLIPQAFEISLYFSRHSKRESLAPVTLFGKGAMTPVEDDIRVSGPHSTAAVRLSRELEQVFAPIREQYCEAAPYFWLRARTIRHCEASAQYHLLTKEVDAIASEASVRREGLMATVGAARVAANPWPSLIHGFRYWFSAWGLGVESFPPFAKEFADWRLTHTPNILPPDGGSRSVGIRAWLLFPATLVLGVVSFVVALSLSCSRRAKRPLSLLTGGYLCFSGHFLVLFTSFANVPDPRYTLVAVPLVLVGVTLYAAGIVERSTPSDTPVGGTRATG